RWPTEHFLARSSRLKTQFVVESHGIMWPDMTRRVVSSAVPGGTGLDFAPCTRQFLPGYFHSRLTALGSNHSNSGISLIHDVPIAPTAIAESLAGVRLLTRSRA